MPVELSKVTPDFEALVSALKAEVSQSGEWSDTLISSTGTILLELMAAVGTFNEYSIEKALRESHLFTAVIPESVASGALSLGRGPKRKKSATVAVQLQHNGSGSLTIPRYTQFTVDGVPFYNANSVSIPSGVSVKTTLTQGSLITSRFIGTGAPFQRYVVGSGFSANDDMMAVTVDGENIDRIRIPFWKADPSVKLFQEITLPDGSVEIVFPNKDYGFVPPKGSEILITYAESLGSGGNKQASSLAVKASRDFNGVEVTGVSLAGTNDSVTTVLGTGDGTTTSFSGTLPVLPVTPNSINITAGPLTAQDSGNGVLVGHVSQAAASVVDYETGVVTVNFFQPVTGATDVVVTYKPVSGAPSGGADETSVEELRYTAPRLFAAGETAVRRDDWKAIALAYSADIKDVAVWGEYEQSESSPKNASFMNNVWICLLTSTGAFPRGGAEEAAFRKYMDTYRMVGSELVLVDAQERKVRLTLRVFIRSGGNPESVTLFVRTTMSDLFSIRLNSLGHDTYKSDIIDGIKEHEDVDFVIIDSLEAFNTTTSTWEEVSEIRTEKTEFATLNLADLNLTVLPSDRI